MVASLKRKRKSEPKQKLETGWKQRWLTPSRSLFVLFFVSLLRIIHSDLFSIFDSANVQVETSSNNGGNETKETKSSRPASIQMEMSSNSGRNETKENNAAKELGKPKSSRPASIQMETGSGSGRNETKESNDAKELGKPNSSRPASIQMDTASDSGRNETKENNAAKGLGKPKNSKPGAKQFKYFILAPPNATRSLLTKITETSASSFYAETLNEDSAEMWLHRAFENLSYEEGHTLDPSEADVFLLPGYFHLNRKVGFITGPALAQNYKDIIIEPSKPHLLLVPTTNPTTSRQIGILAVTDILRRNKVNLWSVGFERNKFWQRIDLDRIVSIPYVLRPKEHQNKTDDFQTSKKVSNSVFYAGDGRQNAIMWAGCNRTGIVSSLHSSLNVPNASEKFGIDVNATYVQIMSKRKRLAQDEYNSRMSTSEYCLILCGDTPTSRSLVSAMVAGCIPIFMGSRLRGLCEPPCKKGWGWDISGPENPHLPFGDYIPWDQFPEVSEQGFIDNGAETLSELFRRFPLSKKETIRSIMKQAQPGWIYGWGDPVTSNDFGDVHKYLWETFQRLLFHETSQPSTFDLLPVLS